MDLHNTVTNRITFVLRLTNPARHGFTNRTCRSHHVRLIAQQVLHVGSFTTGPFVFIALRFKLATSCIWLAKSVIVTAPALTPPFVVALSLPLSS
ncbi:hypothetical protein [Burkholderia cepacia]|uniref:hypothetical protein n=1 Tax=Burkholderia cepacia TaxID=292 RepID=UPI00398F88E0